MEQCFIKDSLLCISLVDEFLKGLLIVGKRFIPLL